jgi:hypothetical protein
MRFAVAMLMPKQLQKNADECLRLACESNEIRTKLALIEMGFSHLARATECPQPTEADIRLLTE